VKPTHALTINGQTSFELSDVVKPAADVLARSIGLLDGERKFALLLWRLPVDRTLDEIDLKTEPVEYLQCAGSASRLTIEVSESDDGIGVRQYVLGTADALSADPPTEEIRWQDHTAEVYSSEVFDSSQAIEIFSYYLLHNVVAPTLHKRTR
jgi:hypothetical protein